MNDNILSFIAGATAYMIVCAITDKIKEQAQRWREKAEDDRKYQENMRRRFEEAMRKDISAFNEWQNQQIVELTNMNKRMAKLEEQLRRHIEEEAIATVLNGPLTLDKKVKK